MESTNYSQVLLVVLCTVFIFYNKILHGISATNIVCTCSYLNMHNPRLVSTSMGYVESILVEVSDTCDFVFNDLNCSAYDNEQCEDTTFE